MIQLVFVMVAVHTVCRMCCAFVKCIFTVTITHYSNVMVIMNTHVQQCVTVVNTCTTVAMETS